MQISTAELRKFKANSSFIKSNNLIPITDYLKFQDGRITKSNLHSFYSEEIGSTEDLLVDEKILFNFIGATTDAEITIVSKSGKVTISDSRSKSVSPTDDIANYPTTPESDGVEFEFTQEMVDAISTASKFTDSSHSDMRSHVFAGDDFIVGSNGFVLYEERFNVKIPRMVLAKEVAAVISRGQSLTHSSSGNFDFFSGEGFEMCFIKSTYSFAENIGKMAALDKSIPSYTISKDELISFCDWCIATTKSDYSVAKFEVKDGHLLMTMDDIDWNIHNERKVPVVGEAEEVFSCNPVLFSRALKNVPDNDLVFYQKATRNIFTGDSGFIAMTLGFSQQ